MYSFASIVKDRTKVQRREIPALVSRLGNPCNRHTWTVSSSSSESFIRHRVRLYTSSSPLQKFSSRIFEFYHVKERSNEISLIYLQFIEPNQSTINLKIIPPTFKTESLLSLLWTVELDRRIEEKESRRSRSPPAKLANRDTVQCKRGHVHAMIPQDLSVFVGRSRIWRHCASPLTLSNFLMRANHHPDRTDLRHVGELSAFPK